MSDFQLPEFLTFDEVVEVDKALLTSQDKFLARIALYSLRVLKQIAAAEQVPIDGITDQQIADWIEQDQTLRQAIGADPGFQQFFTQIVLSSLGQLRQIAAQTNVAIDALTIPQVIAWFEQAAKQRLQG
jgi:type II secretory pathway component PulK